MNRPNPNEEKLFLAALELPDTFQREAFLNRACSEDVALRARIRELLAAHDVGKGPLDQPADGPIVAVTVARPDDGRSGMTIAGKYKLLNPIGEGGMGTVWVAEQREPVKRLVAVKLIRAGMDSKSVLARFEAERQALALMDHPNIAGILDGGITDTGSPYFVMELVKGVPITEYCDARKLTPQQRLKLFIPVCQAIQHAHQKGIIHRDITLASSNPTVSRFQADNALSYHAIGLVKIKMGRPVEAREAYEAALSILRKLAEANPTASEYLSDLGGTLNNLALLDLDANQFEQARLRLNEAVQFQRKALAPNPSHPVFRRYLVNHLTSMVTAVHGLNVGVAEAERELAEFRDSDPAILDLDNRLSAILTRNQDPLNETERLRLGQRAYDKALYAMSARLWSEALAANPILAHDLQAGHRYNAACASTLAASGKGQDEPAPDEKTRAKLRQQAFDWLNDDLIALTTLLTNSNHHQRLTIAKTMQHWKHDSDLSGIRDAAGLEALTAVERESAIALWQQVDEVLKIANTPVCSELEMCL